MTKHEPAIHLCRVYDVNEAKGARLLVDRLWPRGVSKAKLQLDEWLKDLAPSDELRHWFDHDPAKWDEFRERYFAELDNNPLTVEHCLDLCAKGPVTLLYSARDIEHNQALALREYLIEQQKKDHRANAS